MSNYEVLVFVHVLAVAVWVGGAVVMQALGLRALRSDDPAAVARRAGDVEWVGTRIFAPANFMWIARIELLLLIAVIAVMVAKPGL